MVTKYQLLIKKAELENEITEINKQLKLIQNLEKPYVANVSAYSGHYSMQFKTEAKARKKLDEYYSKDYFKNGLNYGVYLYRWNEDGTRMLLDFKPKGRKDFYPGEFQNESKEN